MDDDAKQAAFMSALVTEHFVLQSAASTTVSEASGRASLYLSAVSSSLVAMGFAAQAHGVFLPFAGAVIPALLVMGFFTIVRLVDTGVQNLRYLAGIAHIRAYYRTLTPEAPSYFTPWGEGVPAQDEAGGEASEALAALSRRRGVITSVGTTASLISAINSLVAGAGAALALDRLLGGHRLAVAVPAGVAVAVAAQLVFYAYQYRRYMALTPYASGGPAAGA
jgi:hypothetical protein